MMSKLASTMFQVIAGLLLCLGLGSTTSAAELELKDVLESVRKHHPLLLAVLEERKTADADLLSAQGAFDPSIKLGLSNRAAGYYEGNKFGATLDQPLVSNGGRIFGGYRRSDGRIPVYEGDELTLSNGEFSFGGELPLLRDGPIDRRRANIQRFEIQGGIADASIEDRLISLSRGATNLYWDWVAAGKRVEIFKKLLEVAEARNTQISKRVSHGDLPAFDLSDNQRQVYQRQAQLVQANRVLQNIAFELSLFLRDLSGAPVTPTQEQLPVKLVSLKMIPSGTEEELILEATKRRPEIKRIDNQRLQNQIEISLAENQMLPRLDFQVMASQDSGRGSNTLEEGEVKAGVKVDLPLRVRTAEGRKGAAEAKDRELARLLQFQTERISTEIKDSLNAIRLVIDRFDFAKKEIRTAKELEEGERTRFNLGDSNLIFINLREQTAAEAALREIEAFLEYQKSVAAFRAAMAYRIEEIIAKM